LRGRPDLELPERRPRQARRLDRRRRLAVSAGRIISIPVAFFCLKPAIVSAGRRKSFDQCVTIGLPKLPSLCALVLPLRSSAGGKLFVASGALSNLRAHDRT
jgi:hypothetical protein